MKLTLTALAFAGLAAPTFAQDIEAGAKTFNQCQTCHVVQNEAGETLAGKNAKTGPNLYGVVGRVAGSLEGFKYGAGIEELTAKGFVWTEADIAVYVQDPTKFLVEKTGDKKAKSKMMFKLKKEEDAKNVAAFLASLAPAAAPADAAAPAEGAVTE
ncbi:c-type cytochrome [Tabrizicola sp. BL-A-41-H6]|uniref:c-type cytochrome n=1 Tax=Tabrizicola sp. BL-A-41-H6 TaxID=3421107 RepID=UPI003D677CF8